jgi:hypothetical protein
MVLNSKKKSKIFIGCPPPSRFEKSLLNVEVSLKILILCDFHLRNPDIERMDRRGEERVSEVERAEKYSPLIKSGLIFHSVYAAGKSVN